jgi:hypothetical protein
MNKREISLAIALCCSLTAGCAPGDPEPAPRGDLVAMVSGGAAARRQAGVSVWAVLDRRDDGVAAIGQDGAGAAVTEVEVRGEGEATAVAVDGEPVMVAGEAQPAALPPRTRVVLEIMANDLRRARRTCTVALLVAAADCAGGSTCAAVADPPEGCVR